MGNCAQSTFVTSPILMRIGAKPGRVAPPKPKPRGAKPPLPTLLPKRTEPQAFKPKPDPHKIEGNAVLLCYKDDNRGTLYVRYVVDVAAVNWEEERALAYFVPRRPVPAFTFTSLATQRKTLTRGATPGKALYTGWVDFCQKAIDLDGDVVLLRTGSLSDPHGFVTIVTLDAQDNLRVHGGLEAAPPPEYVEPVTPDLSGYCRQPPAERAIVRLESAVALAVVGGDNTSYEGVRTMPATNFVVNAETQGRGVMLKRKDGNQTPIRFVKSPTDGSQPDTTGGSPRSEAEQKKLGLRRVTRRPTHYVDDPWPPDASPRASGDAEEWPAQ